MNRRKFLRRTTASVGVVAVAGCGGQQGETTPTDTDSSGGEGTPTDTVGTTASGGDWPDLDGKRVLFLTEEGTEQGRETLNQVASDFNDATGADAKVETLGADELNQRTTQLIQAGDPPELVAQPMSVAHFYGAEALAPLNGAVERFRNRYGELDDVERVQIDGDDYFSVLWGGANQYFYRDDVIDSEPETWDQLLTIAEENHGEQDLSGTYVAAGQSICVDVEVMGWGYSNGAQTLQWDGDTIVPAIDKGSNREKWIEVFEYFDRLHEYSPEAADGGCSSQINALADGNAATGMYPGARPKIQAAERGRDFAGNLRATIQPKKESHTTVGNPEGLLSFAGSNTEAAQVFADFLYQPKYYFDMLMIAPLHNAPPQPLRDNDQFRTRLTDGLHESWSEQDVERSLERSKYILNPAIETDPGNSVGRLVLRSQVLSQIKNEVLIQDKDPGQAIDDNVPQLAEMLEDAQES